MPVAEPANHSRQFVGAALTNGKTSAMSSDPGLARHPAAVPSAAA
jgi:hypothetical protein